MSEIERKWWYLGPVSAVAALLTIALLAAVGVPVAQNAWQWIVFFLCFVGIKRTLSLLVWMVLLCAAPRLVKRRA